MKTHKMFWGIIAYGIMGALLSVGTAGAQPFPGGLPRCLAELGTCTADLGTCNTDLTTCQMDPADCQVFPGDGAGSGPALSYTNNGDGTATDNNTLLMSRV